MEPSHGLILPVLGSVYRGFAPYTTVMVRLVAGLSLVPHGYIELFANPAGSAAFLEQNGFRPGAAWSLLLGSTEFFGGLALAFGLLTRLACVPIFIFLLVAIYYHSQFGYLWNKLGFEYPLFWAIVVFHFLIHGGGRYSVDAWLGRQV